MAPLNPSSVALITASSAGLGAAVARIFATHNVRVVINFNSSADKANKLLGELKELSSSSGGKNEGKGEDERYIAVQADMSKEDVNKLVEEAVSRMGRLDVGMLGFCSFAFTLAPIWQLFSSLHLPLSLPTL
jgi:NAD(P)-dependent dehydrogenase (short-subunit alcohol dehydrogenase family)